MLMTTTMKSQFIEDDGEDSVMHVDAHSIQSALSASAPAFILPDIDPELLKEYLDEVKRVMNKLRRDHYSSDFQWVKDLHLHLPPGPRSGRNVDNMVDYAWAACDHDAYIKKSLFSIQHILDGEEDRSFFNDQFLEVLSNIRPNQFFKSPSYCNLKNFPFDYLLACFLDDQGKSIPQERQLLPYANDGVNVSSLCVGSEPSKDARPWVNSREDLLSPLWVPC